MLRIPTEQTVHQRFGIVVHQVLERYHSEGGSTLAQMLELLDVGLAAQRGFGEEPGERELLEQGARSAHALPRAPRTTTTPSRRGSSAPFAFRLGPHHLRGRVDRVDRLGDGAEAQYELIDYKTSRPKTAEQLADDVQLSLYALAAREEWQLESSRQAYYYVLDDLKVPVPRDERDADAVTEHRARGRRGHPRAGLRADALAGGVLDLRLPHRLPRRRGLDAGYLPSRPRWRRKRWNSRASMSPEGTSLGPRPRSSLSAASSSRSTKAWMSGSLCTASPTWRS